MCVSDSPEVDPVQHPLFEVPVADDLCVVPCDILVGCEIQPPSIATTAEPASDEVRAELVEVL